MFFLSIFQRRLARAVGLFDFYIYVVYMKVPCYCGETDPLVLKDLHLSSVNEHENTGCLKKRFTIIFQILLRGEC
jgi:hypothetical protein